MPEQGRFDLQSGASGPVKPGVSAWTVPVLVGLTALAFLLRLYELDARSLSHPEVYVPGIELIPGHSVPEPRLTLRDMLWMHYHDEPHPIGWYLAMFGWVKLFGTGELALRLPSAILGAASVPVMFLLGRRVWGPAVGLAAAILLSLHGFHLLWSQQARMYVTGGFLSILATWLLIRLATDRTAGRGVAAGYVATLVAGVSTVELFWPLIGIHVLWAVLLLPRDSSVPRAGGLFAAAHRLVGLQTVGIILAAPELLHGVYRARRGAAEPATLEWMREYLSFGFLFRTVDGVDGPQRIASAPALLLVALALMLLLLALRAPGRRARVVAPASALPVWPVALLAVLSCGVMVWLAGIALHRNWALYVVATGPLLVLTLPRLAAAIDGAATRFGVFDAWRRRADAPVVLNWLLGLGAPLVLYAAAPVMSLLADRAFLAFVPYLLLLLVSPIARLPRGGAVRPVALALVLLLGAASVPYSWKMPGSPRDYKGLVTQMAPLMQPG
ncbi:MAG: glycosyltransferase family 39 protein, partial [Jhaorihella sp.]